MPPMTKNLPLEIRLSEAAQRGGWVVCLASGFYFGFAPVASGTFGALWGLPVAWLVAMLPGLPLQAAVIAALCLVGIPLSTAASKRFGDLKDPGYVVFDEIASMPITFFGIGLDRWDVVVVGFLLHRLFDITKPPPARQLERLSSGLGIMADDCMAGVYSNLALHAVLWSGILQKVFG